MQANELGSSPSPQTTQSRAREHQPALLFTMSGREQSHKGPWPCLEAWAWAVASKGQGHTCLLSERL